MSIINQDMKHIIREGVLDPELLRNKRFLLLGSTGMILSYAARFLAEMNEEYSLNMRIVLQGRSIERLRMRHNTIKEKPGISFEVFDISTGIPDKIFVDYVIHGASPANGVFFLEKPVDTISPNVRGAISVLEYAKDKGVQVLYMSSTAIYGDVRSLGIQYISEHDYGIVNPLESRASYYESKRLGEQLCNAYNRQYGVEVCIARIPYTYGPCYDLSEDSRIFPRCIKKIITGKDIELFHEDKLLQYTYVGDVVSALLICLLRGESGEAYNVCRMDGMSMENMVMTMASFMPENARSKVIVKENDDSYYFKNKKTVNLQWMSNLKLESLGWKSCFSFNYGLRQTIQGIKELNY